MASSVERRAIQRLAAGRDRAALQQCSRSRNEAGPLQLCGLWDGPVFFPDEIRQRHRLAELLAAATWRRARAPGSLWRHAPNRSVVPALWRAFGTRVQRRSATDRPPVLHERRGPDVPCERGLSLLAIASSNPDNSVRRGAQCLFLDGSLRSRVRLGEFAKTAPKPHAPWGRLQVLRSRRIAMRRSRSRVSRWTWISLAPAAIASCRPRLSKYAWGSLPVSPALTISRSPS